MTSAKSNTSCLFHLQLVRAGRGLTPYEDEIISWTDSIETSYEINAVSLASDNDGALWEFITGNVLFISIPNLLSLINFIWTRIGNRKHSKLWCRLSVPSVGTVERGFI